MSHLKNSNYKMTYEDVKKGNLDNAQVIYNTKTEDLQLLNAAKKNA